MSHNVPFTYHINTSTDEHLYARKYIDILQFQCICSLARGLFFFLTNTASMMLLSTRNHTYKSSTPRPSKKQSQTPQKPVALVTTPVDFSTSNPSRIIM